MLLMMLLLLMMMLLLLLASHDAAAGASAAAAAAAPAVGMKVLKYLPFTQSTISQQPSLPIPLHHPCTQCTSLHVTIQVAINWTICKGAVPIPGAKSARQAKEAAGLCSAFHSCSIIHMWSANRTLPWHLSVQQQIAFLANMVVHGKAFSANARWALFLVCAFFSTIVLSLCFPCSWTSSC